MNNIIHVVISLVVFFGIMFNLIPKQIEEMNNSLNGLYVVRRRLLLLTYGIALICIARAVFFVAGALEVLSTEMLIFCLSWLVSIGIIMMGFALKEVYDLAMKEE